MIGVFGYFNSRNLIAMGGPLIAAVSGGLSMVILLQVAKRVPAIKEFTLGIAMLAGMTITMLLT
jgi:hypothetical protein